MCSVAAFKMMKHESGSRIYLFHQKALRLSLVVGCIFAFLTALNGHSSAQYLHEYQPEKLAAAEGLFETQSHAPLAIGGVQTEKRKNSKGPLKFHGRSAFLLEIALTRLLWVWMIFQRSFGLHYLFIPFLTQWL